MSDIGMERFYRSALNELADVVFGGSAPGVFGAGRKSDEELAAELYRAVAERCIPPSGAPVTHDGCIVREGWTYFRRKDGLELTVQAIRGDVAVTRIGPVKGDEGTHPHQFPRAIPPREVAHRVHAQDEPEPGPRQLRAQLRHRVVGVRAPGAPELAAIQRQARLPGQGQAQHRATILGRRRRAVLQRLLGARHQTHLV